MTRSQTASSHEWKVVGWDHNPPDPFPGFGGKVGLGQDIVRLDDGTYLMVFHAGYWHLSAATPMVTLDQYRASWSKNGYPQDHVAPQGGRIFCVRSSDEGRTWTRPQTVLVDRWDVSPVGINHLGDGRLVMFVNQQASWYGPIEPPEGHLPVNTRIGVMCSDDRGQTWGDPQWLESPQPFYQRAYAEAVTRPDGVLLYPTYTTDHFDGVLNGAIHQSADGGRSWQLLSTLERPDGGQIDEPSLTVLADGRLMLMTRLDAAVFYSEDGGRTWVFSHHAPFAPLKAHRTTVLSDGTVVCWMTSHGTLRVSWSTDHGASWHLDEADKPFELAQRYGYPGGCVLEDESIFVVYYDAVNGQCRTDVWALRFGISDDRKQLQMFPAPVAHDATPHAASDEPDEIDVDVM